jgi:hypothetical protein
MPLRVTHAAVAPLVLAAACGLDSRDLAFVERDDVALSVPAARAGAEVRGEAHELVAATASAVDGWVGDTIAEAEAVVDALADHRETRRDGAFHLFGPFDDLDGRPIVWLVKIAPHEGGAAFEILVGEPGAGESSVELALAGELDEQDGLRTGEVTIAFDVIDRHAALRPGGERLAGAVDVAFARSPDTGSADVELRFDAFVRDDGAGDVWSSDDTFAHARDADGAGSFRAVIDPGAVADPALEGVLADLDVSRVELVARWDASAAGRARGAAPQATNPESALGHGDLLVHECFDAAGGLSFRGLNEPYAADRPSYALGDPATCVFTDADLDAP